jgi:hypothetical protein
MLQATVLLGLAILQGYISSYSDTGKRNQSVNPWGRIARNCFGTSQILPYAFLL